jgi:hypothetical protein
MNQEEPTREDNPATREPTVFGMSVKNYAETQVRFLEGLNSPRSKIEPWEYPFDPYEVKVDSRGPTGLGPSGAGRPN